MIRKIDAKEAMDSAAIYFGNVEAGDVYQFKQSTYVILEIDNRAIWFLNRGKIYQTITKNSLKDWTKRTTWYSNGFDLVLVDS